MTANPLVIDEAARAKIAAVIAYAMDHPYTPKSGYVPGDDPGYVAILSDYYRAVFTFTHYKGGVYRHLTVSVRAEGKYPHPTSAIMLADEFGFTGWERITDKFPDDWRVGLNEAEHCAVLLQQVS